MIHRPGFSLPELIVSLGIFSILMATSLAFYRQQGRAFTSGNDRMTLMQNLRFGANALEQNLRTVGVGVPAKQPVIVYAGERVFSFNADYATNQAGDPFAVYRDPSLPASAISAVPPTRAFTIPGTTFVYPDSAYFDGGSGSPAETITFFFALDTSTARLDDYVLRRQVNDGAPEIVARNLLRTSEPFFTYLTVDPNSTPPVRQVPASYVPAAHTVPIHGSPGDTGIVAAVDSVRAVRVAYAATNGLEGARETRREISRLLRLPNAGIDAQPVCGNRPVLGVGLAAAGVNATQSTPGHNLLSWNRAVDESGGERDVVRYVIWRKPDLATEWGDPLVSIAAGSTSYTYQDFTAVGDQEYRYALAAQDCTPQHSSLATTGAVEWK